MNLEDQVVSLPLAKKLKELGVKQDGAWFCWDEDAMGDAALYRQSDANPKLAAFTVAELGEMLPAHMKKGDLICLKDEQTDKEEPWCVAYREFDYETESLWPGGSGFGAKTEADARAKMLIYLIEKKRISV